MQGLYCDGALIDEPFYRHIKGKEYPTCRCNDCAWSYDLKLEIEEETVYEQETALRSMSQDNEGERSRDNLLASRRSAYWIAPRL